MKLFNKRTMALLICVITINIICVISVSYAYFTAQIKGNEDAEEMIVHAGTMTITYADTNEVSLDNAIPGDSVTKTFKVENTGTLDAKYNIRLDVETNEFEDRGDLEITLSRDGMDPITNIVPATGENGYILINQNIYSKTDNDHPNDYLHNYSLKVTFKNDLEDPDQNDNINKEVKFKVTVDSEENASLYEYVASKSFSKIIKVDNNTIFADEAGNIRYAGADTEVNNYIWFNCNDYAKVTDAASAQAQKCEKWRIIGLFKDIEKVEEDGNVTKQDLVKIVRSESIGNYSYDNKDKSTGAEEDTFGKNDWTTARLMMLLNPGYETESVGGSLYYDWSKGQSTKCYSTAKNGTSDCDFSETGLKNDTTRNLIENVIWHLGSNGSISYHNFVASDYYNSERGDIAGYEGRPTVWPTEEQIDSGKQGKVGIIYPSDYGFATSGGETTSRESCLTTPLYHWAPSTNEEIHNDDYPDCYNNNWLYEEKTEELFLMPAGERPTTNVYGRAANGHIHSRASDNSSSQYLVRPTLYLKSSVKIKSGEETGGAEAPYILVP